MKDNLTPMQFCELMATVKGKGARERRWGILREYLEVGDPVRWRSGKDTYKAGKVVKFDDEREVIHVGSYGQLCTIQPKRIALAARSNYPLAKKNRHRVRNGKKPIRPRGGRHA